VDTFLIIAAGTTERSEGKTTLWAFLIGLLEGKPEIFCG
jgi:hypothetical protein